LYDSHLLQIEMKSLNKEVLVQFWLHSFTNPTLQILQSAIPM